MELNLKAIFQREKSSQSTGLPKPPSIREMIEDIESSSKQDPVILFANRLQRKGPRKSSVDGSITDVLNTSSATESINRRKNSDSDSVSPPSTPSQVLLQPNFPEVAEHSLRSDCGAADPLDPMESIYYKLRQFISLSEQTQETTADVDSKLKMFEKESKEFLKILGIGQDSASGRK